MTKHTVGDDIVEQAVIVTSDVDRDQVWLAESCRFDLSVQDGEGVVAIAGEILEVGDIVLMCELIGVGTGVFATT